MANSDPDADIPLKYRKKIVTYAPASELTRMLEKRKKAKDGSAEKKELETKIRAYVKKKMNSGGENKWKPRTHEHFDEGTPTSHLQGRVRKYHQWKEAWYNWDLQEEGKETDSQFLKRMQAELRRRKRTRPTQALLEERSKWDKDRAVLNDKIPLEHLKELFAMMSRRKRYNKEEWDEADQEYLHRVKKLMQKARLARTMAQKKTPYKEIEHFVDLPSLSEDKKQEEKEAKANTGTRKSGRANRGKAAVRFDDEDYGTGGNPEDEAENRTATRKKDYVPRTLFKQTEKASAPTKKRKPGMYDRMTKDQEKRLSELYYGNKKKPGATYGPRVLYRMMLKEGDTPNLAAVRAWVKDQAVDQVFAFRRTDGEELSPNKMDVPMAQMGMDLFTVTNQVQKKTKNETAVTEDLKKFYKDYGANGFVLLVVDHYSRYAFTAPIRNKSDKDIAKALPALLDKAEAMGRAARPDLGKDQRVINSMRSDNGGEFKGEVLKILKDRKIKNIKTLSGTPQSNAIVERTVGTIRRNLAKQFIINPRSWRSLLVGVTDVYNKKYNKTIKQTPHEAAQDMTNAVTEARRAEEREQQEGPTKSDREDFKVGQRVLLRLKDKQFNKSSGQTYYKTPLKIAAVHPDPKGVRATRYTLESDGAELKDSQKMLGPKYPRRNLLPIGKSVDPENAAKMALMKGIAGIKFKNRNITVPRPGHAATRKVFTCDLKCTRCTAKSASGRQCKNRVCIGVSVCHAHRKKTAQLVVKQSTIPNAGKGLFAFGPADKVIFKKNAVIGKYSGELISREQYQQRYGADGMGPYTLETRRSEHASGMIFVDSACKRGLMSMANGLKNRSQSNAKFSSVLKADGTVTVRATKNIKGGQEIKLYYGPGYFKEMKQNTNSTK